VQPAQVLPVPVERMVLLVQPAPVVRMERMEPLVRREPPEQALPVPVERMVQQVLQGPVVWMELMVHPARRA
jgi:hypothetical protein